MLPTSKARTMARAAETLPSTRAGQARGA